MSRSRTLPWVLLLLTLSTVFLFGNDRGHFYRSEHHNYLSSHGMAMAANLSPAHNFLMFVRLVPAPGGQGHLYAPYNRFPIGSVALTKLAILPFNGDLSKQIYAARVLMLLCFAASAVLACLSLARLTSRWAAVTATLLVFSSSYCLYYNDMVFNDVPSLFGMMLAFHGMVTFARDGRFRQLVVKTCAALLLGWQVFGLLLAFILLSLASGLVCALRARSIRTFMLRSRRPLTLGIVALAFGTLLLTFNLANEYVALNGAHAPAELPTVQSALRRTGQSQSFNAAYADMLAWPNFLVQQLYRVGGMSVPYGALSAYRVGLVYGLAGILLLLAGAAIILSACLLIGTARRDKVLLSALALSGLCWALPMRGFTAFHDFQSLFYVGFPLVCFALLMHRLCGDRLVVPVAGLSACIFVLSTVQMRDVGHDEQAARRQAAVLADFEAIRRQTIDADRAIFVPESKSRSSLDPPFGAFHAAEYYLSGRPITYRHENADLRISRSLHADHPGLLTPENRLIFLYDESAHNSRAATSKESGQLPR